MKLKSILFFFCVVCCLLLTACTDEQKNEWHENVGAVVSQLATAFDEMNEQLSVRALEESNAAFKEPDYVDWQTARHYYAGLDEKEQLAYRCVYNGIFGQPERIAVPTLSTEELNAVFTALRYDNPQLLFVADNASLLTAGMNCYFIPEYTLDYWDARDLIVRSADAARAVLQNVPAEATQFDVLVLLHDELCGQCVYSDKSQRSAHCDGALIEKSATCAGYAKALKLMLDIAQLDSCTVTGTAANAGGDAISHMWLAVCADGEWFYCDPTWDDPVSEDGTQTVEHGYFALSNERLLLTHSEIEKPAHISCENEPTDYYMYKNLFCTQENYCEIIQNGMVQALEEGKHFAEFRFETLQAFDLATQELISSGGIYSMLDEVAYLNENLQTNRIGYSTDEKRLQLKLIFAFE